MAFLSPYRVLDLSDERGLIAGRMLADLGADVVLVEPPGGSSARACPPLLDHADGRGASLYFDAYAANRRGIVADPASEEGRELIRALAAESDILIESAGPGVLARYGLDWPDLQAINPALIYVSITAFGRTGPKAHYAESDLVVWAAGGPLDPHRDGDRPPIRISIPQTYLHAGADAAGGALLALHARALTGRGQLVDVSAQASLGIATLGTVLAHAIGDRPAAGAADGTGRADDTGGPGGKPLDRIARGSGTPAGQKKWPCKDGVVEFQIGIGPASGAFTGAFMAWLVDEGAADAGLLDIDWKTVGAQLSAGTFAQARLAEIRDLVASFLASKSKAEVLAAAVSRKLLCVPVYDAADVVASDQLAARGFWTDVGVGERRRRLPGRFAAIRTAGDDVALRVERPAPLLGEHTAEVLQDWLGRRAAGSPAREPLSSAALDGGKAATGPRAGVAGSAPDGALGGLRVLDLSWVVAGPVIGRALADFGATVIRVESSTRIETARHMPPHYGGVPDPENSALYVTCNCGKLGMTVDLQSERGRAIVRELAAWSDVVIESFSPGLMGRWGLDYAALSANRDDLIMLSTSLMGQTGPAARLAGFGNVGAALSGFQDVAGWPDRPTLGPYGPYTDYVGPRFSIAALLAALDERRRTGRGCYIDVAQVEAGVYFQSAEMADAALTGRVATRMGNADRAFAPHGVYPCRPEDGADRFAAIAVRTDEQWRALTAAIGRPDLRADPDFAQQGRRRERAAELDAALGAWTAGRTAHEVERALQAAGVPAHVSAASRDFCLDPQLAHRGHLLRVSEPLHGVEVVEGPRYLLSETPGAVRSGAPTFGRDNERVLREVLGWDAERIAEATALGVLR